MELKIIVSSTEAELIHKYAQLEGKTISDFIKDAVLEKIEDETDLAELRKAVAEDDGTRYTFEQVMDELGF